MTLEILNSIWEQTSNKALPFFVFFFYFFQGKLCIPAALLRCDWIDRSRDLAHIDGSVSIFKDFFWFLCSNAVCSVCFPFTVCD